MKNNSKKIYSLAFVLVCGLLQAQETFPDDTQDLPVNDYLIPMLVLGIAIGFLLLRKRTAIVK